MTLQPRRAGVIGWPIGHSRSPLIHSHWLRQEKVNGTYDRYGVPPAEIDRFFAEFVGSGLVGANVTIPYKEKAFAAVDVLHPMAKALGAVNTLWVEDGVLHGDNTDGQGFLANLDHAVEGFSKRQGAALVLGAGGAARAVIFALIQRGFAPIYVANRTVEKARQIKEDFGSVIVPLGWEEDEISKIMSDPALSLLVHTTSLGMAGQPPLNLDLSPMAKTVVVTDLIYAPLETDLIQKAKARGNPAVGGLGMLIYQAVPGFERWFGVRPTPDDAVFKLVIADLNAA